MSGTLLYTYFKSTSPPPPPQTPTQDLETGSGSGRASEETLFLADDSFEMEEHDAKHTSSAKEKMSSS
jgi:hypothetical protein